MHIHVDYGLHKVQLLKLEEKKTGIQHFDSRINIQCGRRWLDRRDPRRPLLSTMTILLHSTLQLLLLLSDHRTARNRYRFETRLSPATHIM